MRNSKMGDFFTLGVCEVDESLGVLLRWLGCLVDLFGSRSTYYYA